MNGKDDKDVLVTFTAPDQWTFTPPLTPMRTPGTLRLTQPKGAAWEFVGARVLDGGAQFDANGSGKQVTIHNRHAALGRYTYAVTVAQGGREYTSPAHSAGGGAETAAIEVESTLAFRPPQIINEA